MRLDEMWREIRRSEVLRRRALGPAGRIAEMQARVAVVNQWIREWSPEAERSLGFGTPTYEQMRPVFE